MCNDCCICYYGDGGCLAGMRDDNFVMAEKEQIISRLDNNLFCHHPGRREKMKITLIKEYLYDYDNKREIIVSED